jgi:cell shape-determining protein MreC
MQESPTVLAFIVTSVIGGYTSAIVWLVKRNDHLEKRIEDTNRETIDALKAAAKLGEKVPDMTAQLQQSSDENRLLRLRIEELERRS